jgi:hypothetical protein
MGGLNDPRGSEQVLVLHDQLGLSFFWYYAADFIRSISPGRVAQFAYLADIVDPESRSKTFGSMSFLPHVCFISRHHTQC